MRTLVLDIETAPNVVSAWGLFNQNISINQIIEPGRIICWAAKWLGKKEKVQFAAEWQTGGWDDMIDQLYTLVDEADAIISYNGRNFDMKHIKAAFLLRGLTPPAPYKDIDLYLLVRKQFQFPSKKLDYIAQALEIGAKTGHAGMPLWNEVLRPTTPKLGADARALMEKYNKQDVKLTEDSFYRLQPWLDNSVNVALYIDDDKPRCTGCGSSKVHRRGYAYTSAVRYRRFRCDDCGKWLRSRRMESTTELRSVA